MALRNHGAPGDVRAEQWVCAADPNQDTQGRSIGMPRCRNWHGDAQHRDGPVQEIAQGCPGAGTGTGTLSTGMLQCRNWHRDAQHRDVPGQELAQGCSSAGIGTEMLSTGMPQCRNWHGDAQHRDAPGQELAQGCPGAGMLHAEPCARPAAGSTRSSAREGRRAPSTVV